MNSQAAKASKPNAIYADHVLNNLSTFLVFWGIFHSKKHQADAKVTQNFRPTEDFPGNIHMILT